MGRPRKTISDSDLAHVEALAAFLTIEQIAEYLGMSPRTFQRILERDAKVLTHYKKGKSRAIAAIAQSLAQKARSGDTASAIFYLKTQAGWREHCRHCEGAALAGAGDAVSRIVLEIRDAAAWAENVGQTGQSDALSDRES